MTQRFSAKQIAIVVVIVLAFVALSLFAIVAGMYQPATPAVHGNTTSLAPIDTSRFA